jgi:dsDNA-specific endonuclease/ATPase MutS2
MSEEQKIPPQEESSAPRTGQSSWQEVGQQFQALGESLAQAMRAAWQNEETQRRLQEMRTGLESMARDVGKAVEETANTPQGQKIRQEAQHTATSLRTATEQTIQEVRPQLINALQNLNDELQKLVSRIESSPAPGPSSQPQPEPPASSNTDPNNTL